MSTPILVLSKASFLSQGNFPELYEIFIYDILSLLRSYIFVWTSIGYGQHGSILQQDLLCKMPSALHPFWCFSELYPCNPNQGQSEGDSNFDYPLQYAPEKHVETGFGYFRDFYLLWLCPAVQYFAITSGELLKKTPKNRSGLVTPRVIHPGCCARLRSTPCCSPPFTFRLYRMIYTASTKIASEYWYSYCR